MRLSRVLILSAVGLFIPAGCASRVAQISGVYELVTYHGKPIPFDGVRGGQIRLELDRSFSIHTLRAVDLGHQPTVTDTALGRFNLDHWSGACTAIFLRVDGRSGEGEQWAEICDNELVIPDEGIVFKRAKHTTPGGRP